MMVKPDLRIHVNEPIDTNAWPEPENDIATCSSVSASLCLDMSGTIASCYFYTFMANC